jgi:hypothetical protein
MTEVERPTYRNMRDALAHSLWSAEEIAGERALWPKLGGYRWAHDPDVGLVECSYTVPRGANKAGIDGSSVTVRIGEDGARQRAPAPGGLTPRINSYGNSFTHGDQVNDAETWLEYLGGHLLEPIRNFGLSGGSVYQTYLRMLKEEAGPNGAPNILFYIFGDDHLRSIIGWVTALVGPGAPHLPIGNPAIGYDLGTSSIVERECWLPDRESLDRLGDLNWQMERFGDDLVTELVLVAGTPLEGRRGEAVRWIEDFDESGAERLAADFGVKWTSANLGPRIHALLDRMSLEASIYIIEKARRFAAENGKKIMFLLFDPTRSVRSLLEDGTRYDQLVVDHLRDTGAEFFDMTQVHVEDIQSCGGTYEKFRKRFLVGGFGHYSPVGNHFFAFALKDHLVRWLDPKPSPYLDAKELPRDPPAQDQIEQVRMVG